MNVRIEWLCGRCLARGAVTVNVDEPIGSFLQAVRGGHAKRSPGCEIADERIVLNAAAVASQPKSAGQETTAAPAA